MAKKLKKKVTTVQEHLLHVPVSKKNPTGLTIRDRHLRQLEGTYLDKVEIESTFKNHSPRELRYPSKNKLEEYPDVVKALIASESGFRPDPKENKKAFGISQITLDTLKIVQNSAGEASDFIFKNILKKDLKDPNIAIPIGIRWLFRKRATAMNQLGRAPDHEELILEYKGLLKSNSTYKKSGLKKYRKAYDKLKK